MMSRLSWCLGWLGTLLVCADARWSQITDPGSFRRESPKGSAWVSPEMPSPIPFRELVVSWNLREPVDLEVEVQARTGGVLGRWWHLGRWSGSPSSPWRTSVAGQRDGSGSVDTDTLMLAAPAEAIRLRVRFQEPSRTPALLKRIDLAFWSPDGPTDRKGTGSTQPRAGAGVAPAPLEVPRRSQADDPEGVTRWCSPTSLSMLLAYWAGRSGRPEWDLDVRTVAAGVHDPGWPGTGNWAFNAAYAGSRPGLQAAAVRLGGLADLQALIDAGIPVATSVSYAVLKGGARPEKGDGHLIVVCGIPGPTVIVNDPGVRRSRVQREFPVSAFLSSWEASHRTAYVVWPEGRNLPASPLGTW